MLTSISIKPADHVVLDGKIKKLAGEWVAFSKEKNLEKQVKTWAKENDVKKSVHAAKDKLNKLAKKLDKTNDISGWAKDNKVKSQIEKIVKEIDSSVKTTKDSISIDETKEADIQAKV